MPAFFLSIGLPHRPARSRRSCSAELPSRRGTALRRLTSVASGLIVLCLAACASGPPRPTHAQRDLAAYETLPSYRAFAAAGQTLTGKYYIDGWSKAASSIDGAANEAVSVCAKQQARTKLPPCGLYAIGNIVVANASPAEIERAKCIYILNPTAKSLDDPFAALCAAAQTMKMTLPGEGGLPGGGSVLMTQLATPGDASGGRVVLADLSGSAGTSDASAELLTAEAIRDQLAGNTLAIPGTAYIYLDENGTAVRRTGETTIGSGRGFWRVNSEGYFCARWPKIEHGREVCRPIVPKDDTYEIGDLPVALVRGNAFGL